MIDCTFALVRKLSDSSSEYYIGASSESRTLDLSKCEIVIHLPDNGYPAAIVTIRQRTKLRYPDRGKRVATIEGTQLNIPLLKETVEERECLIGSFEFPFRAAIDLRRHTFIIYPKHSFSVSSGLSGDARCIIRANEARPNTEEKNAA